MPTQTLPIETVRLMFDRTASPTATATARYSAPERLAAPQLSEQELREICPKCKTVGCNQCPDACACTPCWLCAVIGTVAGGLASGLIVNAILKSKRR